MALTVGIMVLFISMSFYAYQIFFAANFNISEAKVIVYIYPEDTGKTLAKRLQARGALDDVISFAFLSRFLGYDKELKVGRYQIPAKASNWQVLQLFRSGIQTPLRVVLHSKHTASEYVEQLCEPLQLDGSEFWNYLQKQRDTIGLDSLELAALFIPNTYEFYWTVRSEVLLKRLRREYQEFWNPLRIAKAKKAGLTPLEVATLASIVDAEQTQKNEEKPRIAGLYLNRIRRNQYLQADPTIVFAHQNFSMRRILTRHLEIDSPYNTYQHLGLPPGPIRIATVNGIDAVLNYESHRFLYMCAKEDFSGYHNFATTYRQHLNNARRFQRALNNARIYR